MGCDMLCSRVYPEPLEVFDWIVCGGKCQVAVLEYSAGERGSLATYNIHGELLDPGSPAEEPIVVFELWDGQGRYAPVLERMMTKGEYLGIVREVIRRAHVLYN